MRAKFPGKCFGRKDAIEPGDNIVKDRYGWSHVGHKSVEPLGVTLARRPSYVYEDSVDRAEADLGRRERERDEAEYQKGLADGRRYHDEVKAYGRELADAFAAQDEWNAYWKYGEDY